MAQAILALLFSLTAPLFLLPIEKILPHPHFIEEAVKLLIVLMILRAERKEKENFTVWVFMAGLLFAVSESIFYLVDIFALGDFMVFPKRLVLTSGLHVGTVMLMYFLGRKNYLGLVTGFAGAVLIHYFYNLVVNLNSF